MKNEEKIRLDRYIEKFSINREPLTQVHKNIIFWELKKKDIDLIIKALDSYGETESVSRYNFQKELRSRIKAIKKGFDPVLYCNYSHVLAVLVSKFGKGVFQYYNKFEKKDPLYHLCLKLDKKAVMEMIEKHKTIKEFDSTIFEPPKFDPVELLLG